MSSIQSITADIEFAQNLGHVAQSYASLAASKLSRIRTKIESTRTFFEEVAALYHTLRRVGAEKYKIISPANGKTAAILLTSNQRFYGPTNTQAAEKFLAETSASDDLIVVGKTGNDSITKNHASFVFGQDVPTNEELSKLLDSLSPYTRILAVHPQTKSILEVVPQVVDVTASVENTAHASSLRRQGTKVVIPAKAGNHTDIPMDSRLRGNDSGVAFDFIFEPEIKKMIEFFNRQAVALLLGQAFLEAELAREAARLIAMDTSQQRAKEYVQVQLSALRNLKNISANKHLLEGFMGVVEE